MSKIIFLVVTAVAGLRLSQGVSAGLFKSYIHGGRSVATIDVQYGQLVFKNRDEFPYMAGLECIRHNICGASIIQKNAVLTAASCLDKCDIPFLTVTAGGIFVAHHGVGQTIKVRNAQVHPDYKQNPGHYNDIAVVWTTKNFLFGPTVRPIRLADQTSGDFLGEDVFVLGWGMNEVHKQTLILMKGAMQVLPQHFCQDFNGKKDEDRKLCTIDVYKKVTPCIGDNGSPLVMHNAINPGADILVGLVSFAGTDYGKCNANFPSAAIRVSAFHRWVTSTLVDSLQTKRRLRPIHPKPSLRKYLPIK